jgi:hypothetical protein
MFITGVNDTGDKLFSGVNDTGEKFIAGVVDIHGFSIRCHEDVSTTDVSPNEKSRIRPFDSASLGRCVPWTIRPLDDTSL